MAFKTLESSRHELVSLLSNAVDSLLSSVLAEKLITFKKEIQNHENFCFTTNVLINEKYFRESIDFELLEVRISGMHVDFPMVHCSDTKF